jgi:hypothetical protein
MEKMERISYATPEVFVPAPVHIDILNAVAGKQGCHISDAVHLLYPAHSENSIRSGVRVLLSKRYLDGGKSCNEIMLRLTSRGRLLIQPKAIT